MILINSKMVDIKHFPNEETSMGEQLINFVSEKDKTQTITLRFETNEDLINLMFVKEWMEEEGYCNIDLYIPYLPYSRMDRKVGSHLYTLKYIAKMINQMNFKNIFVLEAHSDKTLELLKNVTLMSYTKELVEKSMADMEFNLEKDAVVFPDKGAKERYKHLLNDSVKVLQGVKDRDFKTGDILGIKFEKNPDKEIERVLIVDDLCSRGGTFCQISDLCEEFGIEESYLAVTHLESNVYTGKLFEKVEKVFTTDAMEPFLKSIDTQKIKIVKLPKKFNMTIEEEI